MAEALYRKYRPQIFEDVVGQEQIERTIKNAIEQDKVSHAYLFCGPRGTGKTTTARLLAKALLCEKGPTPDPDGTCEDCTMIADGVHPDVYELDAASRTGVENVREEIINRVQFAPTRGRYKVYIIDEVHMLSIAAFNALLKTLEEPPSHVVFILATTDPQKVPETIHSRCQRFDFRRISNESIVSRLGAVCVAEGVEFEGDALDLIAHHAGGGMRNALTSLEQMITFGEGKVTLEVAERTLGGVDSSDVSDIVKALGTRDGAACFKWIAEYCETGSDLAQFVRELAEHIRNLYVMSLTDSSVALEVSASERRQLESELPLFGSERLARMLMVLGDVLAEMKTSTNPRLSFEIASTRMIHPEGDVTLAALAERIETLELGAAAAPATPPVAQAAPSQSESPVAASQTQPAAQAAPQAGPQVPQPAAQAAPQPAAQPAPKQQPAAVSQPVRTSQPEPTSPAPQGQPAEHPASSAQPAAAPQAAPIPQPAASPASDSPLAAMFSNPAALQRMWQTVLATLKRAKAAYGVLFLGTKAIYDFAANMLQIEFPKENAFAFKAVQKQDVQDAVGSALTQACSGYAVPFVFTQAGAAPASASFAGSRPAKTSAASPLESHPAPTPHPASVPSARERVSAQQAQAPAPASFSRQTSAPAAQNAPASAARPASADSRASHHSAPASSRPGISQADSARSVAARTSAAGGAVPPWEDEQVPYDDASAVSFDEQVDYDTTTSTSRHAASSPAALTPAAATVPAANAPSPAPQPSQHADPPAQAASKQSAQPAQTPEDLQSILQAGFGGGVTFEEVD